MNRENENRDYCKSIVDDMKSLYDKGNLTEYFNDFLDCEYRVDKSKGYLSARVFVTLGGPNVWIDTDTETVELRWGNDRAFWDIPSEISDYIDEIFQEIYDIT